METTDTFEELNLEKLEVLLTVLKDAEIPYFRFKELEIRLTIEEEEPEMGFVPAALRAGAQAARADEEKPVEDTSVPPLYRKAFGQRPVPKFSPASPKE